MNPLAQALLAARNQAQMPHPGVPPPGMPPGGPGGMPGMPPPGMPGMPPPGMGMPGQPPPGMGQPPMGGFPPGFAPPMGGPQMGAQMGMGLNPMQNPMMAMQGMMDMRTTQLNQAASMLQAYIHLSPPDEDTVRVSQILHDLMMVLTGQAQKPTGAIHGSVAMPEPPPPAHMPPMGGPGPGEEQGGAMPPPSGPADM